MIFEKFPSLEISRPEKFGGDINIESYDDLEKIYSSGKLHPADLKTAVAISLNTLLTPVRKHFLANAKARKLADQVKDFEITR